MQCYIHNTILKVCAWTSAGAVDGIPESINRGVIVSYVVDQLCKVSACP
jgi:hypothetical protein